MEIAKCWLNTDSETVSRGKDDEEEAFLAFSFLFFFFFGRLFLFFFIFPFVIFPNWKYKLSGAPRYWQFMFRPYFPISSMYDDHDTRDTEAPQNIRPYRAVSPENICPTTYRLFYFFPRDRIDSIDEYISHQINNILKYDL